MFTQVCNGYKIEIVQAYVCYNISDHIHCWLYSSNIPGIPSVFFSQNHHARSAHEKMFLTHLAY
jgi:hypothetical protein